jgi:histidinol-phosphate aminotransferase
MAYNIRGNCVDNLLYWRQFIPLMSIWDSAMVNKSLKDLVPYEPGKPIEDVAREFGLEPGQIIKLASNENPLGPSPAAREAICQAAANSHIYPDGGGYHLREAIASSHGLSSSQVILGNGSNEIIELAYHAFTRLENPRSWPAATPSSSIT